MKYQFMVVSTENSNVLGSLLAALFLPKIRQVATKWRQRKYFLWRQNGDKLQIGERIMRYGF